MTQLQKFLFELSFGEIKKNPRLYVKKIQRILRFNGKT